MPWNETKPLYISTLFFLFSTPTLGKFLIISKKSIKMNTPSNDSKWLMLEIELVGHLTMCKQMPYVELNC